MGRELQKKKNRSSIPKIRQKPKSKKLNNPRANPIIAANWDKSISVAQNYRNLGLTSRLNHRTGGIEKHKKFYNSNIDEPLAGDNDALAIGGQKASKITLDEVEVVRDPETGKILRVVGDDAAAARARSNPLNDPLNDIEEEYEEKIAADGQKSKKRVVKALEELAARGEEKRPRKQSQRERAWIKDLIQKHGDNYKAMSRDRKLNPMQQSEGDIKARVQQWRQLHGSEATDSMTADDGTEEADHHHHYDESLVVDDTKPRCACRKSLEDFEATLPENMRIKVA